MNEQLINIRDFIQTYGLYIQIIALAAYIIKIRKVSAFIVCVVILLLFTVFHYFYEKQLLVMAQQDNLRALVSNLWYLGFAYTDAFLVLLVLVICRKRSLKIDRITRLILLSYISLGLIQIARYIDRIIYGTDKLGSFYSIAIPSINISITALICLSVALVYIPRQKASN